MSEHTALVKAAAEGEAVVQRVIDLWNNQGGWIPGAAYPQLAEVLGVSTDRLKHYDIEKRKHYVPPGVKQTIEADRIKARDRIVVFDQARVEWISHLDEFYVMLKVEGVPWPTRWSKWQMVTLIRGEA